MILTIIVAKVKGSEATTFESRGNVLHQQTNPLQPILHQERVLPPSKDRRWIPTSPLDDTIPPNLLEGTTVTRRRRKKTTTSPNTLIGESPKHPLTTRKVPLGPEAEGPPRMIPCVISLVQILGLGLGLRPSRFSILRNNSIFYSVSDKNKNIFLLYFNFFWVLWRAKAQGLH